MGTTASGAVVEIDLDAGADAIPEAWAVMRDAFAQYADKAQPSGALLETVESVTRELAAGVQLAIARRGARAVAMVKYACTLDGYLYFSRLAVAPDARGCGLAARLLRDLRAKAVSDGLHGLSCSVRAAETGNVAMYEHLGMRVVSRETRISLTGAVIPVVLMADV